RRIGPGLVVGLPSAAALDPSHPGWIYTATAVGVFGRLWLTTDSGATWMERKVPSTNFSHIVKLLVDPDQSNTLFAVTLDGIYKSTDGAETWTRLNVDALSLEVAPALLSR